MLRLSKNQLKQLSPPKAKTNRVSRKNPRMQGEGGETEINLKILLAPRPKERARTYADKGVLLSAFRAARGDTAKFMANVMAGLMKTVTPEDTRVYEKAISSAAEAHMSQNKLVPFSVPVFMSAVFVFKGTGNEWPVGHLDGDLDNLEKALLDGLNGIAWIDDRLVTGKTSCKTTGEEAGIFVKIWPAPSVSPESLSFFTNGLSAPLFSTSQ